MKYENIMIPHLKKSLCNLPTRRFGEFVEILTSKLNNLENSKDNSYDRTKENERIEIKGSRVFNNDNTILTEQNVLQILNEEYASRGSELISDDRRHENNWNCNIQQIKPKYFDVLYYSLFFENRVVFFKIPSSKILTDKNIKYSGKQHRGNKGEGQFHIDCKNIEYHLLEYFYKSLTYDEVVALLENRMIKPWHVYQIATLEEFL